MGTRRYIEERASPGDDVTVVGHVTEQGEGIDPLVVSDRSPGTTVLRMAKTSVFGLGIGTLGLFLGLVIIYV